MITLQELRLRNFMNIDEVDLDFSSSYISIFTGSNGAGKSSIIEAIAICFTERRRGDSFKDFIKHGNTSASIHLKATYDQHPVVFDVELVNKSGWTPFKRQIKYKGITYKNSECTPLLESFGLDYLQHIMFSLQGENNVVDLKPSERTKVLKRIFDFELKPQIDALETRISQDQQALLVAQTQYDLLSNRDFVLKEEQEELSSTQVKRYEMGLEEVERKIREAEQRAHNLSSTQTELQNVRQRITSLKKEAEANINRVREVDQHTSTLKRDIAAYTTELENLESDEKLRTQIEEKQKEITTLQDLIDGHRKSLESHQEILDTLYPQIMELTTHIEAHKQGVCPACGQDTAPSKVPAMESAKANLVQRQRDIQVEQENWKTVVAEAERSIAKHTATISSLEQTVAANARTRTQYTQFLERMNADIVNQDTRRKDIKNTEHSLLAALEVAEKDEEQLQAQLDGEETDTAQLYKDQQRLRSILDDDKVAKALNVRIREQNQAMESEKEQVEFQLQDLISHQNTLTANIAACRDAKRILSVDLPNYIIVKACSKLEKHINSFIANVKPGMVVRLLQNKRGVEFFYSPKGEDIDIDEWMSTKMASGFERELLSAAWRVALAKAYSLDILMLDEIDSAASVQASEKMFQELATLEGFEQMIIISHKPEVVDVIQAETDRVSSYNVEGGIFTLQTY